MDPQKLKVVELRAELTKRGLDSKGNKPVLVDRLRQALEEEEARGDGGGVAPTQSESTEKTEQRTDLSTDDEGEEEKSAARRPPRTPSRSSRHTSREPTTPARTPTRRSSSRSSMSRQSPAKTILAESLNEATPALEPIVEEDKSSPKKETPSPLSKKEVTPKKEVTQTTPKKDTPRAVSPKKDTAPTVSSKKDADPSPKKDIALESIPKAEVTPPTPKKEPVVTTPKKENIVQNESPVAKKDEKLEIVKEAEQHTEKSQEITRRDSEELCKKANAQSPNKSAQSPLKPQTPVKSVPESPVKTIAQSPAKAVSESPTKAVAESPTKAAAQTPVKTVAQSPAKTVAESPAKTVAQSPDKTVAQSPVKSATPQKVESPVKKDASESPNKKLKSETNEQMETEKSTEGNESKEKADEASKSSEDPMDEDQNEDRKMDTDEQDDREERKRKRTPSPHEDAPRAPPVARPENEPILDDSTVVLSWYDSDLNLVINPLNYSAASPMQGDGFNYMWAGARATYGFNKGKVYYEARITSEFNNMSTGAGATEASGALPADEEKIPSLLRLGWSVLGTSLQLGEHKLSYGYEGTGKKSTNKEFVEYGKTFGKDDVVGCYADFESDADNVILTYTVNGEDQGPAFTVKKEELEGKALFPHMLSRNCSFSVNWGQEDNWSQKVLDGYTFVGKVDLSDRIVGSRRPEKREDCEVILLCGLPCSGKTSWATKYVAENPDKIYSVLGTHSLIERMTVQGKPLKDNFKGRWETVVEKCTRAMNKLLESAPSRRRNYILDQQANVYGSAQKRKMRNFYGFHRKAIVMVPSDEEFKSRIDKRKEDGDDIRDATILEVKANLTAPSVGESFEEVVWVELNEEEGKKLIETYNTEGKTAGFGQSQQQQNKRSRFDNGQKDRNNRDNRDHRRQGYNDRRNSGAWRGGGGGGGGSGGGGGGGGGWRDGGRMRGGPMRHSAGYGHSPGGWRGRGGAPMSPRTGPNDRRQGNDRNRSGGGHRASGGWNAVGYQGAQHGGNQWGGQSGNWQSQSQSGGWSGGQQQSGSNWGSGSSGQQQAWGGAGNWKGYGQNSYGQQQGAAGYGNQSSGYGNGNWNNWGGSSQYYNQYWGGSGGTGGQQQQTGGQAQQQQPAAAGTGSGQAVDTTTVAASNDGYDYTSNSWQDYSQYYDYSADAGASTEQRDK